MSGMPDRHQTLAQRTCYQLDTPARTLRELYAHLGALSAGGTRHRHLLWFGGLAIWF